MREVQGGLAEPVHSLMQHWDIWWQETWAIEQRRGAEMLGCVFYSMRNDGRTAHREVGVVKLEPLRCPGRATRIDLFSWFRTLFCILGGFFAKAWSTWLCSAQCVCTWTANSVLLGAQIETDQCCKGHPMIILAFRIKPHNCDLRVDRLAWRTNGLKDSIVHPVALACWGVRGCTMTYMRLLLHDDAFGNLGHLCLGIISIGIANRNWFYQQEQKLPDRATISWSLKPIL